MASSDPAGARNGASDELVKRSIALILTQTRVGMLVALVVGALLGGVFVPTAGWQLYLAWYGIVVAGFLIRQGYFEALVRRQGETPGSLVRIALVSAFTGWLAVSCVPLFTAWISMAELGVLTIVMVGWIAVAVSVLAVQPAIYNGYLVACFGSVFIGWIPHADGRELALIGLSMVLGALMLAKLARTISNQLRDTVEMAQQNAGLVEQLRAALASQQEAQRARSRFLGAASHDLRQPVQALLFLTDLFRNPSSQTPREALAGQMVRTVESIDSMFRHLVDFAQIDAGTMKAAVQTVHLDRLVHAAVSGFAEKCAARGLAFRLHMEDSCTVSADPVLLERLLRNFLDNACKFSLRGEIAMRVCCEDAQAVVTVEDQGVGMDASDLEQAFNAFYRGRSASAAEAEGIGLGLAICKHMADRMGAQLALQSRLGVGTSISVRLPLAAGSVPQQTQDAPRQALQGLLVAVLEDERLARDALCVWLAAAGARIVQGASLRQLHGVLERSAVRPDYVVADFRLQEGTGIEAIAALRAQYGPIPAVIVSGERGIAEADLGVPVLQKPVTPEHLLRHIRQAVPAAA